MVQPEDVVPSISIHNKQLWIPMIGLFITPFALRNWRSRTEEGLAKHASTRANVNQGRPQQQQGPNPRTSNRTPAPDHQQQSTSSQQAWDKSQYSEHQLKKRRDDTYARSHGSTSYSGPQQWGSGSSSSNSRHWNSWYDDTYWKRSSW